MSDRHAMAVLLTGAIHMRVYRLFALRVTGDAELMAEDIVSEAFFFEVWRHADRFIVKGPGFHMAAHGDSTKQGGYGINGQAPFQPATGRGDARNRGTRHTIPEVLINKRDRSEAIQRCLSQLSAVQQDVIDTCLLK